MFLTAELALMYAAIFFSATPDYRQHVMSALLFMSAFMGGVNGYITCKVLKLFGATDWIFSAAVASLVFPSWVVLSVSITDLVEVLAGGSVPITFIEGLGAAFTFYVINSVLSFIGAFFAYTTGTTKKRVKTNPVKRRIPQ